VSSDAAKTESNRELPLNAPVRRLGAVVFALSITGTACGALGHPTVQRPSASPTPDATAVGSPFKIVPLLVIGDSISVGARDIGGLPGLLEGNGWIAEIVAEVGVGVPWALQQVEPRLVVPRIVLVELGSNPGPNVDDFENEVHQLIDALVARGARHIIWIPPEARDPTRYAEKAAVIARAAGSTVTVSGWPAKLEQNPQWFGDELHLTQEGYRELALFIRDELLPLHG
jgi:lysophospholipase L1-like esterase